MDKHGLKAEKTVRQGKQLGEEHEDTTRVHGVQRSFELQKIIAEKGKEE